jgi:hypothetical protein
MEQNRSKFDLKREEYEERKEDIVNETLKRLQDGIAGVKSDILIMGPGTPVGEGETVIGELTDLDLRRFFIYHCECIDAHEKMASEFKQHMSGRLLDLSKEHNMLTCPECLAGGKLMIEGSFVKAVANFFWAAVKASLTTEGQLKYVSNQKGIAIRRGWKIVTLKADEPADEDIFMLDISGPILNSLDELFRRMARQR